MPLADAHTNADASTNSGEVGLPYRADASDKWERWGSSSDAAPHPETGFSHTSLLSRLPSISHLAQPPPIQLQVEQKNKQSNDKTTSGWAWTSISPTGLSKRSPSSDFCGQTKALCFLLGESPQNPFNPSQAMKLIKDLVISVDHFGWIFTHILDFPQGLSTSALEQQSRPLYKGY